MRAHTHTRETQHLSRDLPIPWCLACGSNDFYGELWATHALAAFPARLEEPDAEDDAGVDVAGGSGSRVAAPALAVTTAPLAISGTATSWGLPERTRACYASTCAKRRQPRRAGYAGGCCYSPSCGKRAPGLAPDSQHAVLAQGRQYALDLAPKACLARGAVVALLISANVGRYLDFKAVTAARLWLHGAARPVPCSKQTLLLNKDLSPREKRALMKFLQACAAGDVTAPSGDSAAGETGPAWTAGAASWGALLEAELGTGDARAYVLEAVGDVGPEASVSHGISAVQRYVASLGVYGSTAYIYPLFVTARGGGSFFFKANLHFM